MSNLDRLLELARKAEEGGWPYTGDMQLFRDAASPGTIIALIERVKDAERKAEKARLYFWADVGDRLRAAEEVVEAGRQHLERDATEDHWAVQSRHRPLREALRCYDEATKNENYEPA